MYTIIMYNQVEPISIERYQFIFSSYVEEHKIALFQWNDKTSLEKMVETLEILTEVHHEWRLIIFDGARDLSKFGVRFAMDAKIRELISRYANNGRYSEFPIRGCLPQYVLYLTYRKMGTDPFISSQQFWKVDEMREFGTNFRMLWTEIDFCCELNMQFDLFRLACALLTLAINETLLEMDYGFLYQININIERELFAKYVIKKTDQIKKIERLLEEENIKLYGRKKGDNDYPEIEVKISVLQGMHNKMNADIGTEKIGRADLKDIAKLKNKLEKDKRVVRARLYFPKGVLRDEASNIQEWVSKKARVGGFLNEAGIDRLEREKWEIIKEICMLKPKQMRQHEFEECFAEDQENLVKRAERKWGLPLSLLLLCCLEFIECIMLFPFIHYAKEVGNNLSWLAKFLSMFTEENQSKRVFLRGGLIIFVIIISLYALFSFILDQTTIKKYKRDIKKKLQIKQVEKMEYMEKMLGLVAEYQYCIRLEEEQFELLNNWEFQRKCLYRHRAVWKNSIIMCEQLKHLMVEQGTSSYGCEFIHIKFGDEPQEIEYYWLPYKDKIYLAPLNRSGRQVNVPFDFITKVTIVKTRKIWQ